MIRRNRLLYATAVIYLTGFFLSRAGVLGTTTWRSVQIIVALLLAAIFINGMRLALARLFFFIRNKLIASYIFIAVVPVLLVTLVFAMIGYLTLGQIYAYQAAVNMTKLLDDIHAVRERLAFRLDRIENPASAAALKARAQEMLSEEAEPLRERFPNLVLAVGIFDRETMDRIQAVYANTKIAPLSFEPPSWLKTNAFDGFVIQKDQRLAIKSFAVDDMGRYAVTVDVSLPVVRSTLEAIKGGVGAELRTINPAKIGTGSLEGNPLLGSIEEETDATTSGTPSEEGSVWKDIPIWGIWVINARAWTGTQEGETSRFLIAETSLGKVVGILSSLSIENNILILSFFIGVLTLFVAIELVSLVLGIVLARSITSSIGELSRGTEQLKVGTFSHKIVVHSRDQLGDLAQSFNQMGESIENLLKESIEKERMSEELRIGHRIQQSLLPSDLGDFPGLEISASNIPAREVGGDYFDVFPLGDRKTGIVIADVSGKGIPAAFYMAELKGLALSLSRTTPTPKRFLAEANNILKEQLDRKTFITMSYAVIDTTRYVLTVARAGHSPILLVRAGHAQPEVLLPSGIGLALEKADRFDALLAEMECPLGPGDTIVFYTDGVSEAMDAQNNTFGDERLGALLSRCRTENAEKIRQIILREVNAFAGQGGVFDDRTLIVAKLTDREN